MRKSENKRCEEIYTFRNAFERKLQRSQSGIRKLIVSTKTFGTTSVENGSSILSYTLSYLRYDLSLNFFLNIKHGRKLLDAGSETLGTLGSKYSNITAFHQYSFVTRQLLTTLHSQLIPGTLHQGHPTDRFGKLSVRKVLNPLQFS